MKLPRIGITVDEDEAEGRIELKRSYVRAVEKAGGLPWLLPDVDDEKLAESYLDGIDALVVTGGAFDIDPALYGEEKREGCGPVKARRTRFEHALLGGALARKLPTLGVCGGMQLLAVVRGGSLYQDLAADLGITGHEQPPPKDLPSHDVEIAEGSLLARLAGSHVLRVNTTHHQAVKEPGAGVVVSGRAPDGVVEAIELPALPFALGVQWHPETAARHDSRHAALYEGLVVAARERASRRSAAKKAPRGPKPAKARGRR